MDNKSLTFYIKKNSTLALVEFSISQNLQERYNLTDEMFKNCAVTFSMFDQNTNEYKIANKGGYLSVVEKEYFYLDEAKYTLQYPLSLKDTNRAGVFIGEFKLDFLGEGNCGKITLPNDTEIHIVIKDSITKTTVI